MKAHSLRSILGIALSILLVRPAISGEPTGYPGEPGSTLAYPYSTITGQAKGLWNETTLQMAPGYASTIRTTRAEMNEETHEIYIEQLITLPLGLQAQTSFTVTPSSVTNVLTSPLGTLTTDATIHDPTEPGGLRSITLRYRFEQDSYESTVPLHEDPASCGIIDPAEVLASLNHHAWKAFQEGVLASSFGIYILGPVTEMLREVPMVYSLAPLAGQVDAFTRGTVDALPSDACYNRPGVEGWLACFQCCGDDFDRVAWRLTKDIVVITAITGVLGVPLWLDAAIHGIEAFSAYREIQHGGVEHYDCIEMCEAQCRLNICCQDGWKPTQGRDDKCEEDPLG